jgi:YHS domain-containing protein
MKRPCPLVLSSIAMFSVVAIMLGFAPRTDDTPATRQGMPYPLTTCIVSGEALGEDPAVVILSGQKNEADNGREVKFCCGGCAGRFAKDPATFLAKLNAEIVKAELPLYPAVMCPVMPEEALPSATGPDADEAKNVVYQNRLVRLCCGKCVRRFNQSPAKYLEALDRMIVAEGSKNYPLTTCPISGRPLGDDPVDVIAANRLVRVCCKGCAAKVEAEPMKYAGIVVAAGKAAPDTSSD